MLKKVIAVTALMLSFCFLWAQAPDNWYENKPISSIVFQGLNSVSKTEMDGIFDSFKGKPFSDATYSEILQKLYALDYFSNIIPKAVPADIDYQYVRLEFEVTEKPVVTLIKVTGNHQISRGDILSKVLLKKGDIYNEIKKNADEQTIKNYYIEKGYASAVVSSSVSDSPQGGIILEFTITEGKQTIVSAVAFEGNAAIGEKALKGVLLTKPAKFLVKGIFQENLLAEDKTAIQQFYGERGYIDAHVENIIRDIDSESDPQKNMVKLTYVIMEGEQYTYGGTSFEGNKIFSTEDLTAKIRLTPGNVLNMTRFEQGFQAIADMYFESGYTSNYIAKAMQRDSTTKKVSFVITIVERSRSHIENIIIRGNKRTKDYVILRELLFEQGDVFSKSKFTNSLRNLFNLRYFSTVVPDVQPGSEQNLIDVILNVEEQSTASIQFGITFSGISDADSFPLSLFVQWQERNLAGRGNELSVNATAATDNQTLQLGYAENWFLGYPLTLGFDLSLTHKLLFDYQDMVFPYGPFKNKEEFEKNKDLANAYRMRYDRFETTFGVHTGYRWYNRFFTTTLRGGINFSLVKNFYDTTLYRAADPTVRQQQAKWRLSNSVWTRLSLDGRDITYDPSKGWFLSEQASFFGLIPKVEDEYFFRSETKAEAYITLVDYPVSGIWNLKFVLAFYTGFSFQIPMPNSHIGDSSKLAIDGMFTGRGWLTLGSTGKGNVLINHWIEFRWPLAHGILSFDFFVDAAAIKKDLADLKTFKFDDYYFSFGPGLRFVIPQFPLRLMFANTFRSQNGKPVWGNGKGADWRFVLSFNVPNL
jgi:outer membrane protein assembly complex, yaeT protein|nr:outer membrane protein assembly factor BamA [uncultured Treponema sp.]